MSALHPTTRTVRSGLETDLQHGAVVPPVHLASNFTFAGLGAPRAHDYTRSGNPTRDLLAEALCDLEGAAGGVVTASGMGAITTVLHLLRAGDVLLAPVDGYGGTWRLMEALAGRGAFELRWIDPTDSAQRRAALAAGARMLWLETPSNPLLRVTDLEAAVADARAAGAMVVVDNTFLSPALQQPLRFGADIVVHSTTKYINGHSDVVGGAALAREAGLAEQLQWWGNCLGLTGSPFDAWLTLRGLRTLGARMRCHEEGARAVAEALAGHPSVSRVHWPGLETHPDHALARRQQTGFGGVVSFELDDGVDLEAFVERLACFSLAESLGGVESLVAHPATMTHAAMTAEARAIAGISDRLLRLSVGIEAPQDLCADLLGALAAARCGAASY